MADTSTSGWFNLLDLDEDKSIVAPTTVQGSRYSTNSQGLMSSDVRKMQATKADSAPTDILTTIVNKIINGFSGDIEDLTDRPVAGRDVANDVYKEYDKLVGVDSNILSSMGQLFMDATDPPAPVPASEDPDRKFYQSGIPIEDRVFEATDEPDLSDLQIMDPEGIEDMPPLPKAATDDGGLMSRDTSPEETIQSDVEEAVATPDEGLMSDPRKLGGSEGYGSFNKDLQIYTDEYANVYLKKHEGSVLHKSLEGGKDTEAFGVKFSRGLKRKDFTTDASFAGAVALKHRDEAKSKFKDLEWAALPQSVKFAFTDLNFNVGTIGSTADQATMVDKMKNTLNYVGMTTKAGGKASLIALAERRAWNWNKSSGDIKQNKITKIKQIPTTTGGTTFEYLDANGDLIHSTTTTRTPVKLSKKGIATTLTKTREVTL